MSGDVSSASWAHLPTELLEKIFDRVPPLLLPNISMVCQSWQSTVHRLAVKYLTVCVQNKRIEEKQLEKWGWSSDTAWEHNIRWSDDVFLNYLSLHDL